MLNCHRLRALPDRHKYDAVVKLKTMLDGVD